MQSWNLRVGSNWSPERLFDVNSNGLHNTLHLLSYRRERTYSSKEKNTTSGIYINMSSNEQVHKFIDKTDNITHILCLTTSSRMEKLQILYSRPSPQITSEELKQFQNIVKKYGQTLYPPYYLD